MEKEDIIHDLETNPRYKPFFDKYGSTFKLIFIHAYAKLKQDCLKYKEGWENEVDEDEIDWMSKAYDQFGIIQHKKLFDLQCLWRADQIELKDIEISNEFIMWNYDIMRCPLIEPLSKADVALYKEFLRSDEIDIEYARWYSQHYDQVKRDFFDEEDEPLPFIQYMKFHNERTGNNYLLLPDHVGEREKAYMKMHHRKIEFEGTRPKFKSEKTDEERKLTRNMDDTMAKFVHTYESKEVQFAHDNFKAFLKDKRTSEDLEPMDQMIYKLWIGNSTVPFDSSVSWRKAIYKAYRKHMCTMLEPYLDLAFEEYKLKEQTGLIDEPIHVGTIEKTVEMYKKMYSEGRAWNEEHPE